MNEALPVRGSGARDVETLDGMYRPGHAYRGMTQVEYAATVGAGQGVKSRGDYSFAVEGTSFADHPADAESYVNFGRDDPRKTGRPTYLVEVRLGPYLKRAPDGYLKAAAGVPPEYITRVWEMRPCEGEVHAALLWETTTMKTNPAPPVKKTTYLAIMPRERKARAVGSSQIGWYQQNAREFYEAPGMTAEQARRAIKDGTLKPTWIKGQPVVAYDVATGKARTEARVGLGKLMGQVEQEKNRDAALRLGGDVYTPQWSYRSDSLSLTWHKVNISGFTYSQEPLTRGDLDRYLKRGVSWELVGLAEDYGGVPMGGIVALAQAGMDIVEIESEGVKRQTASLEGRRWRVKKVYGKGDRLTPADLVWSNPEFKGPGGNPAFVKTRRDERLWADARAAVDKQYPDASGDRYWALVNRIFHRMQARAGGGTYPNAPESRYPGGEAGTYGDWLMSASLEDLEAELEFARADLEERRAKGQDTQYHWDMVSQIEGVLAHRRRGLPGLPKGLSRGIGRPTLRGNPKTVGGIHVEWSDMNQAWFVMWNETVLRVFNYDDRGVMEDYLKHDLGAKDVTIPPAPKALRRAARNPAVECPKCGASMRTPGGNPSEQEYRGWKIVQEESTQLGYWITSGRTPRPGKGRKVHGYLLTGPDGARKFVSTLKEAKQYIDDYEGPEGNPYPKRRVAKKRRSGGSQFDAEGRFWPQFDAVDPLTSSSSAVGTLIQHLDPVAVWHTYPTETEMRRAARRTPTLAELEKAKASAWGVQQQLIERLIDAAIWVLQNEPHRTGRKFWERVYAKKEERSPEGNPESSASVPGRAVELYEEFHGHEPNVVLETGKLWVPGPLVLVGHGIDVGYDASTVKNTDKDGRYVHDFGRGVKIWRRPRNGERADRIVDHFPETLVYLSGALGFTYEGVDNQAREVKLSTRKKLCACPDKRTLVVVGPDGVEYLMKGGKMRIADWLYD